MSASHDRVDLVPALEAILFVAEEPVELAEIGRALEVSVAAVRGLVDRLVDRCDGRGVRVQRQGSRVQLVTAPEAGLYVRRFLGARAEQRLSPAALETLAIIAYRQPITRPALEAVRGVNCDHAIATLRARGLIEEVGRAESVGRPVLFGTTIAFLEHFGLEHPADLPPLPAVRGAGAEPRSDGVGHEESTLAEPRERSEAEPYKFPSSRQTV